MNSHCSRRVVCFNTFNVVVFVVFVVMYIPTWIMYANIGFNVYLLMCFMSILAESLFGAMHSYDVPKFQEAMTCFALAAGDKPINKYTYKLY